MKFRNEILGKCFFFLIYSGTEPGTFCDINTGQCTCKIHSTGLKCDQCVDGYYNLGGDDETGCLFCGCDAAGKRIIDN